MQKQNRWAPRLRYSAVACDGRGLIKLLVRAQAARNAWRIGLGPWRSATKETQSWDPRDRYLSSWVPSDERKKVERRNLLNSRETPCLSFLVM